MDACEAVGRDVEVVLLIVEDFVEADREARRREGLSWRDPHTEGWAFLGNPWSFRTFKSTKAPLTSHPRVTSVPFGPNHPSYALWSLRSSNPWFSLCSRRSWIPSDTYRTWGAMLAIYSWDAHRSGDARRPRVPSLTFLSSLPECATLPLIPLVSLRSWFNSHSWRSSWTFFSWFPFLASSSILAWLPFLPANTFDTLQPYFTFLSFWANLTCKVKETI